MDALFHGMEQVWHCTSIHIDPKRWDNPFGKPQYRVFPMKSDIFSFHYVNSLATLKQMKEVHNNEYSQHMDDAVGPRN